MLPEVADRVPESGTVGRVRCMPASRVTMVGAAYQIVS